MKLSAPIFRLKREAKQRARSSAVPLNEALNSIARREGFQTWSSLAAQYAKSDPAIKIFKSLTPGDFVLLGARPGHGKTLMGLRLIVEAIKAGNPAAFFSLEDTKHDIAQRLETLGTDIMADSDAFTFDTSNDICADYIVDALSGVLRGTVIVIDYLQLLDQNRTKPIVATQLLALKSFAVSSGAIVIMISQIDRSYDAAKKPLPDSVDVRMPNPIDIKLFTKTLFINNGELSLQAAA